MSELIAIQQLLNSYKLSFAFKKKISPPEDWYPKTAKEIEDLLESFLKSFPYDSGHVFNLGHGITPDVDPENAGVFINAVHEFSAQYHK